MAALAVVAVVLLGLPAGLVVWAGWPLPRRLPDQVRWQAFLDQPLTSTTVGNTAVIVIWLLWAWTVSVLVAESVARLRNRRLPWPKLPAPLHAIAGSVVGALGLMVTAEASHAATPPPAPAPVPVPADVPTIPYQPSDTVDASVRVDGVGFPGGWLPAPAAAAVAAAGALVWMLRRVHYQPRPPAPDRSDSDPYELPAAVATIRRTLHDGTVQPATAAPPLPLQAALAVTSPAVFGVHNGRALVPGDLPAGGVGLVGPGATDAARGILAAAVAAGARSEHPVQVYTTVADLASLLGPDPDRWKHLPRLHIHAGIDELVADLNNQPAAVSAQPTSADTAGTGWALVLTETPEQPAAITALLGARTRMRVMLLGVWPVGAMWHIRGDGTVRADTGAGAGFEGVTRLGVLSVAAAFDILTAVHTIHHHNDNDDGSHYSGAGAGRPAATVGARAPRQRIPPRVDAVRSLTLRLLGRPLLSRATGDGGGIRIRRSAGQQILYYLAVHRDGATTSQLKETLWADVASSLADKRFRTTMSELRHTLRDAAGVPVIQQTGAGAPGQIRHRLDPYVIDVDLWRFNDAITAAATAIDPATHGTALWEAVGCHVGELAEGHDYEWIHSARETACQHIIDAYTTLARQETDPAAALDLLQAAIRLAPHNEALYQMAITRHGAAGDADGVAQVLQALTVQLLPLGLQPNTLTRSLARQTRPITPPPDALDRQTDHR